jgi:hypothetical protein
VLDECTFSVSKGAVVVLMGSGAMSGTDNVDAYVTSCIV